MPTVSVVIPTYERVDVLPRAVESVLEQTVEDLELIVVDDGSSDGTNAYLESVDDDRLRVVSHETNRGANVARNTGIDRAEGTYVAFLDSDDEWQPEKLERQLARIEDAPETVAVYCDFEQRPGGTSGRLRSAVASILATTDEDRPKEGGAELAGEILADYLHSCAGSTLLVETAVARDVGGFDTDLDRFQDPEFLLRVLGAGDLAYVDAPLMVRHETAVPAPETIETAAEDLLRKHEDLVERVESAGYDVTGAHALLLAKHFLAAGRFRRGVSYLRRADVPARHWPGVSWSAFSGLRRRLDGQSLGPVAVTVAVAAVLLVVWRFGTPHTSR